MIEYKTNDIWLIATLLTYGFIHKSIERRAGDNKKWFIYDRTNNFNIAISDYYSGQLNVPAIQFKSNYIQILEIVKSKDDEE